MTLYTFSKIYLRNCKLYMACNIKVTHTEKDTFRHKFETDMLVHQLFSPMQTYLVYYVFCVDKIDS